MCVELLSPRPRNHPHLSDCPYSPGPFPGSRLIPTVGRKPPKPPYLLTAQGWNSGAQLLDPWESMDPDSRRVPGRAREGESGRAGPGAAPPRPRDCSAPPRYALRSTPLHATRSLARRYILEARGFRRLQSLYLLATGANWYPVDVHHLDRCQESGSGKDFLQPLSIPSWY